MRRRGKPRRCRPFSTRFSFPDMTEGEARQPRVRPALAVLFRVAVGPSADYYAPRFLEYERPAAARRDGTGRRSGCRACGRSIASSGSRDSCSRCCRWPARSPSRRWRRVSTTCRTVAAGRSRWPSGCCPASCPRFSPIRCSIAAFGGSCGGRRRVPPAWHRWRADLGKRAPDFALRRDPLLGGGAVLLAASLVEPDVRGACFEHEVRAKVSAALASVRPLQQQVEESWDAPARHPAQARCRFAAPPGGNRIFRRSELSARPTGGCAWRSGPRFRSCSATPSCWRRRSIRRSASSGCASRSTFPRNTCRRNVVTASGSPAGDRRAYLRHTLASHGC